LRATVFSSRADLYGGDLLVVRPGAACLIALL